MKSEVQKLTGLSRKLNVEVPHDIVNAALSKMYKDVQRVAKFKGFRPGKAPLEMVKTHYRSKVESDVVTKIIEDHYGKAISEHALQPVNFPEIEFDGFKEGESLKFSATFEIRPDVELKKYTGLDVEKEKLEITDASIEAVLQDIQKNKASIQPVTEARPAALGDIAIIDFAGKVDGVDLPGGSGSEHQLELGSHQFIEGFEEGIVGMTSGQTKTLNLQFPTEYHAKDIAGKQVDFVVTLKEIKKKVLLPLDDEFAKSLGGHESLQSLKEEIKKDITTKEEKRVKDDLKNRLLHALVAANGFDVPRSMVTEQKKVIVEDIRDRMEKQGMPAEQFEEYKAKWDQDFEKSAEFVIRSSLLINSVAKKEDLFATDADYEAKLSEYATQSGIEIEKLKGFYSKQENRSRMTFQMTEEKVVDFLIGKAKIKELPPGKLQKLEE